MTLTPLQRSRCPVGLLSQERFNNLADLPSHTQACTCVVCVLSLNTSSPSLCLCLSLTGATFNSYQLDSFTLVSLWLPEGTPCLSDPQCFLDSLGKRQESSLPPGVSLLPPQGPAMAIEVPVPALRTQGRYRLARGPAEEAMFFFLPSPHAILSFLPLATENSKASSVPLKGKGKNMTQMKWIN